MVYSLSIYLFDRLHLIDLIVICLFYKLFINLLFRLVNCLFDGLFVNLFNWFFMDLFNLFDNLFGRLLNILFDGLSEDFGV